MQKKEFEGYIDGHRISGTFTEKDANDCAKEKKEEEQKGSTLGTVVGIAATLLVVGLIVGSSTEK